MFMEKAVEVKSKDELATMRQAGAVVADILVLLSGRVKPGMTTGEIDRIAREELKKRGAKPAFLGYHGFPGVICVSDQLTRSCTASRPTSASCKDGDIIGLDFGCVIDRILRRFRGDGRRGQDFARKPRSSSSVTRESSMKGIDAVKAGARVGDIGARRSGACGGRGLRGRARIRRPRHRPRAARGAADPELRQGRDGPAAQGRHDDRHRADGQPRRRRSRDARRRLDGRDEGPQAVGAFRAHRRGDGDGPGHPDACPTSKI